MSNRFFSNMITGVLHYIIPADGWDFIMKPKQLHLIFKNNLSVILRIHNQYRYVNLHTNSVTESRQIRNGSMVRTSMRYQFS